MSEASLASVLEWSCEERYDYFLSVVGEEREVWILINDEESFLTVCAEEEGFDYLPLWPSAEFAALYAEGADDLTPESIPLPKFLSRWIPGLTQDGVDVGVFPGTDRSVWICEPAELEQDIRDEISQG